MSRPRGVPIEFEDEVPEIGVPKPALIGAALLIVCTIALAATARWTGAGRTELDAPAAVARERAILFAPQADSGLAILDASSQAVVLRLGPQDGGFVRGSVRALRYVRERSGSTLEAAPWRLREWPNGRLTLEDPTTGYRAELNAFGPDNVAAFRRLLR